MWIVGPGLGGRRTCRSCFWRVVFSAIKFADPPESRVQGLANWCTHNITLLSLQCIKMSHRPCTRWTQYTSWFMQILGSGGKRLALGVISLMWSSPIFPNYLGSWSLTARGKNNTPTLVGTPQFWKNHFKKYCKATHAASVLEGVI